MDYNTPLKGKTIALWTAIFTPFLLIVSIIFMGGGHGTYFFAKMFYPLAMIISGMEGKITDIAMWIALLQIPVYGLLMFLVRNKSWKIYGFGILVIHLILFLIAVISN